MLVKPRFPRFLTFKKDILHQKLSLKGLKRHAITPIFDTYPRSPRTNLRRKKTILYRARRDISCQMDILKSIVAVSWAISCSIWNHFLQYPVQFRNPQKKKGNLLRLSFLILIRMIIFRLRISRKTSCLTTFHFPNLNNLIPWKTRYKYRHFFPIYLIFLVSSPWYLFFIKPFLYGFNNI